MDFEIISETSDSSDESYSSDESTGMGESSEAEMSAEDVPSDAESEDADRDNQESQWMDENAHLHANIEELGKKLELEHEKLKFLSSQHESQRLALEKLEAARKQFVEEDNKAEEEKSDETVEQSEDRIRELENTVACLKQRESVHAKRETQWFNKQEQLLGQLEDLKRIIQEKDEKLLDQDGLEEKCKELEKEKEKLEVEYARVAEKVNDLEKKSEETDTKHAQECSALVDQRAELQNVCEELRAANEKLMAEKNRLEEEIHETTVRSQAIIQKLQSNVDDHRTRLRESQQALELLNEQLASTAQQNDLANRTAAELEAKNMEIQERATLEQKLAKREALYKELSEINNEMEEQISKNKKSIQELKTNLQEETKANKQQDANLHSQETQWMEENASVEELKKIVTEKNERLKALNRQHEQVLNEVESQRVALQELEEMKNQLVEEKKKTEEEKKNSDDTLTQLQDRIGELESTVDDLQKRLTGDAISSKSVHDKREAKWLNEKERLLDSIDQLERTVKEGDKKLEVQEALQEKYKELETEKKQLEDKYARVAEEVYVLAKKSEETDTKHAQECSALVDQRAELQNVCEELRAANEKLMAEKNRLEEEIHETTVRSQAIIQKSQSSVDELKTRLRESQQALKLLNEQLASTAQQNDLANRTAAELEAKNMEMQEERARLEQKLAKREALYKKLSEINNEMEEQISKNKKTIQELKTNLQEETKANEQQTSVHDKREAKWLNEKERLLDSIDQLERTVKEGDKKLEVQEALQEKYKELETEKKELEDKYHARVAEEVYVLAKKSEETDTKHAQECSALVDQRAELQNFCEELRAANEKLMAEKNRLQEEIFSVKRTKAGVELNANYGEIFQLQKALEALNDENDVLRKRNQELTRDLRVRSNEKRMDEREKANKIRNIFGKENGGYSSDSVYAKRRPNRNHLGLRKDYCNISTAFANLTI